MRIGIDAMGGDYAPESIVAGAIEALKEFDVNLALVGIKDTVEKELAKHDYPKDKIQVIHAPEVIDMHEPATVSIRQKKKSSISIGIDLLKQAEYDAFISAGNTGAVVAASTIKLRMIEGVERAGIGLILPTLKGVSFLIDVGATTDPKAQHLFQFALMSRVYAREILGIENPIIGLVNIGEEASKGSDFSKEAHKLLAERFKSFKGNVEANEIFFGDCDCIVCDGFIGNIVIKVAEGLMESAGTLIKREVKKDPLAMVGAMLMKSRLAKVKKYADYSEYGGAPLLGVNGIVMISHGRSNPKAIKNAIKAAKREIEHKIIETMKAEITAK